MKKIIVPTDFSKPADWALEVALDIAKKSDGVITLLHVVDAPGTMEFNVEGEVNREDSNEENLFTIKMIERGKGHLAQLLAYLTGAGVTAKQDIRVGIPYQTIKKAILELDPDLVVMGTSGHSRTEEVFVGSNTERIVRHAKCPVLTVHQKPSASGFKNIVYATSLNENEKNFADVVKNAQAMYGSTIHVVRVNTPLNFKPDHVTERLLKNFAQHMKLENFTLNTTSDYSEEEGIIHFANTIGADLIAMATHGRKGFAHVLIGSITEDVVNHSPKPVLTYVVPAS